MCIRDSIYPVIIIDYVFGLEPTEVQRAAERKEIIKLHTQKMSWQICNVSKNVSDKLHTHYYEQKWKRNNLINDKISWIENWRPRVIFDTSEKLLLSVSFIASQTHFSVLRARFLRLLHHQYTKNHSSIFNTPVTEFRKYFALEYS